jgi:hypothetical protein
MRIRDHVALSTAGALVLRRWAGRGIAEAWAASILVDVDHYLWFSVRTRTVNPLSAVRYFNGPHPDNHPSTRILHSPIALYAAILLGARRRGTLKFALGMAAHVALDLYHEARVATARDAALRRDGFACQGCGARGPYIETHLQQQPLLLPSYRERNFVSLCPRCHEVAHARLTRPIPGRIASGPQFGGGTPREASTAPPR